MKKSRNISQKHMLKGSLDAKKTPGVLGRLDKSAVIGATWFENIAIIAIVGIIIANLIDVIGAKLFGKPIAAGTEIVYFLQVIAIAGALAATKVDGKHIRLEFIDSLPGRSKDIFNLIATLLGLGLFILLAWKSIEYAQTLKSTQEVTAASRVPLYPFVFWIAVCCLPLCLILLKEALQSAVKVVRR